MRRSFDGLHGLVTGIMELDVLAGHLFVFPIAEKIAQNLFMGSRWIRDLGEAVGRRDLRNAVWRGRGALH